MKFFWRKTNPPSTKLHDRDLKRGMKVPLHGEVSSPREALIARFLQPHRTAMPPKQHFQALDFYRFVAAFCVMILHMTEFSGYDPHVGIGYVAADFYLFVDFFFILSGFVIGITYFDRVANGPEIFTFLRRRIARIYPLHLATLALYLMPVLAGRTANLEKYDIWSILQQALLVQSWPLNAKLPFNFPAWSISVEWGMYLMFPIIVWVTQRAGNLFLVALTIAGFVGIEIALGYTTPPLWFADNCIIRAIPTFALGILMSRICGIIAIPRGIWYGFLAFVLAIGATMMHLNPYLVVALFCLTVWLTAAGNGDAEHRLFDGPISKGLGDASYALYMVHSITLAATIKFLWPKFSASPPPLIYGLLVCVMTVPLSILVYRCFEKRAKDFISGRSSLRTKAA
jgi:peptidoglycan/LPS O-acetylase OafA/YrhL